MLLKSVAFHGATASEDMREHAALKGGPTGNQQSLIISFLFPIHAFITGTGLQENLIKSLLLTKEKAHRDRKRGFQ